VALAASARWLARCGPLCVALGIPIEVGDGKTAPGSADLTARISSPRGEVGL
jgi:hypothetical protein